MPEGPELYLASCFVNGVCNGRIFSGKVRKSEVSHKNPDVDWNVQSYTISARSRGKELMLRLTTVNDTKQESKISKIDVKSMDILVRFGMSGKFKFDSLSNIHKHAHLNFFTQKGQMVLSFVDYRRFGRWEVTSSWGKERGPCVIQEYSLFRENILRSLGNVAFNKPICEVLLNQRYFNGIGNYLRAEILHRAGVPPFSNARTILEPLKDCLDVKSDEIDILALCNLLPKEVTNLRGGKGYEVEKGTDEDYSEFSEWLQCYYNPSMTNMVDHNGRTIWFSGQAGPLVPGSNKSRKRKKTSHLDKKKDQEYQSEVIIKKVPLNSNVTFEDHQKGVAKRRVKTQRKDKNQAVNKINPKSYGKNKKLRIKLKNDTSVIYGSMVNESDSPTIANRMCTRSTLTKLNVRKTNIKSVGTVTLSPKLTRSQRKIKKNQH